MDLSAEPFRETFGSSLEMGERVLTALGGSVTPGAGVASAVAFAGSAGVAAAPGTCVPVTVVPPASSGGHGASGKLRYLPSVYAAFT